MKIQTLNRNQIQYHIQHLIQNSIQNLIWNSIRNLIIKFMRNSIWNKIWNSIRIQNLVKEVMHENFNQFFFYSDSIRHRNEISNFAHNLALFVYMYYILPVYLWFVFTFFKKRIPKKFQNYTYFRLFLLSYLCIF